MIVQAGTMLHLAAEPRNGPNIPPDHAMTGRYGLLRSLASDTALGPSTTWVPPSGRHASILTIGDLTAKVCPTR